MRHSPTAVMVFAAGFGTRMGALTKDRPKPLIKVGGRCLLDHALNPAEALGLDPIVVNTHYLADQISAHLVNRSAQTHFEDPILETGGGLKAAIPALGSGPVFTMNSDAVWAGPNPFTILADQWRASATKVLLLCVPAERAIGHKGKGDFICSQDGAVSRGQGGLVYTGAQIVTPDRLGEISKSQFSLNELWDLHLQSGTLEIAHYPGFWCDVGQPESIAEAEHMLKSHADV